MEFQVEYLHTKCVSLGLSHENLIFSKSINHVNLSLIDSNKKKTMKRTFFYFKNNETIHFLTFHENKFNFFPSLPNYRNRNISSMDYQVHNKNIIETIYFIIFMKKVQFSSNLS